MTWEQRDKALGQAEEAAAILIERIYDQAELGDAELLSDLSAALWNLAGAARDLQSLYYASFPQPAP